ncbi:MAG TPA: efflux RND transporter periplasmic adaptor subunit [Terriglobia bacterium]|jgi:cobalt-zinc-cadmium efflux system membrane fusion protein
MGVRAKRRRTFWIAAGIIAISAAVFLTTHRPATAEEPQTAKADTVASGVIEATPEQQKQIRVEGAREETVNIDLEATGKVGFNEDRVTPVLAPFPGRVLEVLASAGDVVQTGQPLLAIESPDLVASVNDLAEAHTNSDKAGIAVDIAEKSAERARRLHAQEAISTKDLQAAESELARAQEEYRRAQSAADVARNRLVLLGKSADEIAGLESSPANQTDRRIVIRAPIGGTIVDRKVGMGQYIKPDAADPLFLISDLSSVWITAEIYENDLPRIRVGAPVNIHLAAYPAMDFSARISAVNPTVDPAARTIKVRCLVANPNGLLKPEMFARIRVGSAAKEKAVLVPSPAVLTEGEHSFVLVEEAAGQFRRREVKAGPEIGGDTVVREGLRPDERVVTSGVLLLSSEGNKQ